MNRTHKLKLLCCCALLACLCAVMAFAPDGHAQLPDKTVTPPVEQDRHQAAQQQGRQLRRRLRQAQRQQGRG